MKLMEAKKAQVGNLQGFILAIVSVAVILAVGLIVLGELRTSIDTDGACAENISACGVAGYNSTTSVIDKLGTVPTWIGIIITVSLAFIVLGYFFMKR